MADITHVATVSDSICHNSIDLFRLQHISNHCSNPSQMVKVSNIRSHIQDISLMFMFTVKLGMCFVTLYHAHMIAIYVTRSSAIYHLLGSSLSLKIAKVGCIYNFITNESVFIATSILDDSDMDSELSA